MVIQDGSKAKRSITEKAFVVEGCGDAAG